MFNASLAEIAAIIDGQIVGNEQHRLEGLASLSEAAESQLAFYDTEAQLPNLKVTRAGAVLLKADAAVDCPVAHIIVDAPRLAYAKLAQHFTKCAALPAGIHRSASIAECAVLGQGVAIGPNVVIESGAVIGDHSVIQAGTFIGRDVIIGPRAMIHANVSIMAGVEIGSDVQIFPSAVIGADGFGFVQDAGRWVKIPQIGSVKIGSHVEIGAGTTIDRGAQNDTIIEDNVILDNQIQVAHNVIIGAGSAVAGCVGISGSVTIGKNCMIGGGSCISGHLTITDKVVISGMSMVTKSIEKPGVYSSGVPVRPTREWKRNVARFQNLDDLAKRIIELEKKLVEKTV